MADKETTEENTDPNKSTMLEPGEGDAAGQLEDLTTEMLPTKSADDDLVETEAPDTETETDDKSDTDTETDADDDPDLVLLREHNLDKMYSDVPSALAGTREKERLLVEQRQQMQTMTSTLDKLAQYRPAQQTQPVPLDQEALTSLMETNPRQAMAQMGFVSRDQIAPVVTRLNELQTQLTDEQQRMDDQAFYAALGQHEELTDVVAFFRANGNPPPPGVNKLFDAMDQIYRATPALSQGRLADAVSLLYDAAKQRVSPTTVEKVSDKVKRGASTTSGGRGKQRSSGLPDWDKMTEAEQLQWFKDNNLYDG